VAVNQCSVLFLKPCCRVETQIAALRSLGFSVTATDELPPAEALTRYHAIVCGAMPETSLTMMAARLRAKPHFDRRVLIALVAATVTERDKRDAVNAGFSCVLPEDCTARDIASAIITFLRRFPEYRCLLRAPKGTRRKAA
jgi:CheY-like chemotaxis protein